MPVRPDIFEIPAMDELIAFAKLRRRELLVARPMKVCEGGGFILIPYENPDADEVACCYLFARGADGKKGLNSVFLKLKL